MRTILVVEDEKEIRDLLAHYLRKEGFATILAVDGESALSEVRKGKPDLILLDIMLPNADGLEVLRAIRSDPGLGRTPVIMLTAKGDETDRVVGLELGADDYVPKPFSPREVVARILGNSCRSSTSAGGSCSSLYSRFATWDPYRFLSLHAPWSDDQAPQF